MHFSRQAAGVGGRLGLTEEERSRFAWLYEKYQASLVQAVRSRLRLSASQKAGISASAVAQSVWQSFMSNHLEEVDLSDNESAWRLMLEIAERHGERWGRRGRRHPNASIEASATPEADGSVRLADDLADLNEPPPEVAVIFEESISLIEHQFAVGSSLGAEGIGPVAGVVAAHDQGPRLVERLSPRERDVLALKLAVKTRPEIASALKISHAQVDGAWESIRSKGRQYVAEIA